MTNITRLTFQTSVICGSKDSSFTSICIADTVRTPQDKKNPTKPAFNTSYHYESNTKIYERNIKPGPYMTSSL